MTRLDAIRRATNEFDTGAFRDTLGRRVAMRTESQEPDRLQELEGYLADGLAPDIERLGFATGIVANPRPDCGPFLIAVRHEGDDLPTVLMYGHGDTVRAHAAQWRSGLQPLRLTVEGDRWYGRGAADNKGQHSINLAALQAALAARGGRLGFNAKLLFEMGEEIGSPGLAELCRSRRAELAADVLIASDGPRISAERPTLFLGSRGVANFELRVDLRESGHHSGNWGGLLRNPGTVLANAIANIVDGRGRILVDEFRPPPIPETVRRALGDLDVGGGPDDPAIDDDWGEPGLTAAERVFGWNAIEVLAFKTGDPEGPLNAVPPNAKATLQLRFVVGTKVDDLAPLLRRHLARIGLGMVRVAPSAAQVMAATRTDPEDPWVAWALDSIARTVGKPPALLPNLGGSLPNDVFADILGLPTLWAPHSYPGCSQHAPNEHLLAPLAREGLAIMAGLFWDLGETGSAVRQRRRERLGVAAGG